MAESDSSKSPPSQRRIAEALRNGQLPISRLFNSSLSLFGCCCLAASGAGWAVAFVVAGIRERIENAAAGGPFLESLRDAWLWGLEAILRVLAPACALCWGALAMAAVLQTRGRLRFPGLSRITQDRGRLVSIVVVFALAVVASMTIWERRIDLLGTALGGTRLSAAALLSRFGVLTQLLLFRMGATVLCLVAVDFSWQWWQWRQRLRMTRAEVDEENRMLHGDPLILKERLRLGRE